MSRVPQVGDIVLYRQHVGASKQAAIVTRVDRDGSAWLTLFAPERPPIPLGKTDHSAAPSAADAWCWPEEWQEVKA